MTIDDVNRAMEKCDCCGCAWDEHPGTECLRYKPEARKRVEALIAENARLLIELEAAMQQINGLEEDLRGEDN